MQRKSMEPWIKDEVKYYDHQIIGIRKLARKRNFLLADDMGLGKSLQAITIFAIDVAMKKGEKALVVCPASVKVNWEDEFAKFTGAIDIYLCQGTPAQRDLLIKEYLLNSGPRVLIMNYEQIVRHLELLNSVRFDVVIFDEAHYLKNHKSQRTKACMHLYSQRKFFLTGTPLLNRVNELWPILYMINPKEPDFARYWRFVHKFAVLGGYTGHEIVGVKNERILNAHLREYMLRRMKSEALDLPEVQIIERRVALHPEQQKLYNEVITELRLVSVEKPSDVDNALTKMLRLKQICGTILPFTGKDISSKLDLAEEDDAEIIANGNKVVVFTQFRAVNQAYAERLTARGIKVWVLTGDTPANKRQDVVNDWSNSKEPGALICMFQVAGVGLNMTAARHGSFLDKLFVPGLNQQAIDRMHRIGADKTQAIQIREYLVKDSIESRINEILNMKKKTLDITVDAKTDSDWYKKLIEAARE